MAMEIVNQWKERTGITIAESYGITEVMPITFNHYYPERHVLRSVGHPVHGVEVQIRDTGGNLVEQGKEGGIWRRMSIPREVEEALYSRSLAPRAGKTEEC